MDALTHCKATITKDNVNQIPADWEIVHDEGGLWRFSVFIPIMVAKCKEAKLGFLPLMLVYGMSIFQWFMETWGSHIDVNAEFPYPWLCHHLFSVPCKDPSVHSSLLFCYYNLKFVSASMLIKAGARICKKDFVSLALALNLCSIEELHTKIAYVYLDSGNADYGWRARGIYGNNWLTQQCRIYTERIERCSRATVVLGGILRRQRRIYDRFLIRDMMRVVWNTRVSPDWGDQ